MKQEWSSYDKILFMDSITKKLIKFIIVVLANIIVVMSYLIYVGFQNSTEIMVEKNGSLGGPVNVGLAFTYIFALVLLLVASIIGGFILSKWIHADSTDKRVWSILSVIVSFVISYVLLIPLTSIAFSIPIFVNNLILRS